MDFDVVVHCSEGSREKKGYRNQMGVTATFFGCYRNHLLTNIVFLHDFSPLLSAYVRASLVPLWASVLASRRGSPVSLRASVGCASVGCAFASVVLLGL